MTPYRDAPPLPSRPPRAPRWRVWLAFAFGLGGRMRRRRERRCEAETWREWRRYAEERAGRLHAEQLAAMVSLTGVRVDELRRNLDAFNHLSCADRAFPSCNLEPR